MKIAKVIPIFKSSDRNYRPISLLTSFSKLLEKLMYDNIISFLLLNNSLYEHQYGFRGKHSTIQPIIHLLNHCAEATNKHNSEFTMVVLIDLSKAFDVINHKILLNKYKIKYMWYRGIANDWFESYLSNRTQFVEIDDMNSSYQHVPCGVPQCSILGPLLYLIYMYVNDIWKSCDSKIFSFDDDTTLCVSSPNVDDMYDTINNDINKLNTWFCASRLSLNAKKTKYIVIRPKHKSCDLTDKQLIINDVPLCRIGTGCKETSYLTNISLGNNMYL